MKFIRLCTFNSNTYPLCEKFTLDCALTSNEVFWVFIVARPLQSLLAAVSLLAKKYEVLKLWINLASFWMQPCLLFDIFISETNFLYFWINLSLIIFVLFFFSYQNLFQFIYLFFEIQRRFCQYISLFLLFLHY